MMVFFERRTSAAAMWARRLALFSAILLVVSTAGHRFALIETIAYLSLLGIVLALALTALLMAGLGYSRLWEYGDRGGRAATRGVLVAMLVLLPFGLGAYRFFALPALTDISTDTLDPPALQFAAAARSAGMNRVSSISQEDAELQIAFYPSATGRRYPFAVDRAHDIVVAVFQNLGWRVVNDTGMHLELQEITIEAEARSPVTGFVSDVAVRIVDEGDSSYVDIRSASRYGLHDLGDNAAKIDRFFAAIEAEVLARNAPVVQQAE